MNANELDYLTRIFDRIRAAMAAPAPAFRAPRSEAQADQSDIRQGFGIGLPRTGYDAASRKRDQRTREGLQAAGLIFLFESPCSGGSGRAGRVMLSLDGAKAAAAPLGVQVTKSLRDVIKEHQPAPPERNRIEEIVQKFRGGK